MEGQCTSGRSGAGGPAGTSLTIGLRESYLNKRFAFPLDRCPARIDLALWTSDGLGFPIDGEMGEIIAGLGLIPVGFERGTKQVHLVIRLALNKVGNCDISRIHEMLIGKQFLLREVRMDSGDDSLIAQWSSSSLDDSDELWGIFVTRLSEMHFVSSPERASLLAISRVEVIGRGNELCCWKN